MRRLKGYTKRLKWCTENLDVELKNELSRQYVDMNPQDLKIFFKNLYEKVKRKYYMEISSKFSL